MTKTQSQNSVKKTVLLQHRRITAHVRAHAGDLLYLHIHRVRRHRVYGRQEGIRPVKKLSDAWDAGMVIRLERGAVLHMAQLVPLPLNVSCFSKTQIGFIFLVPAYPGSSGQRAVKRVCVYYII